VLAADWFNFESWFEIGSVGCKNFSKKTRPVTALKQPKSHFQVQTKQMTEVNMSNIKKAFK